MLGITSWPLLISSDAAILISIPVLLMIAPLPTGILYMWSRGDQASRSHLIVAARAGMVWAIPLVLLVMGLAVLGVASYSTAYSSEPPSENPDAEAFWLAFQVLILTLFIFGFCAGFSVAGAAGTLVKMGGWSRRTEPVDPLYSKPVIAPGDWPWSWGVISWLVFIVLSVLTLITVGAPVSKWELGFTGLMLLLWWVMISGIRWAGTVGRD